MILSGSAAERNFHVRFAPIGDIPMLFNRTASLRGEQDQREVILAKNLPRNSPASCLKGNCGRSSSPDEAK
jgi:hypothetical protein